jgi:NAD(P)-dependent dehydrogenase (short-subunit alcohol dehydrogenase family)
VVVADIDELRGEERVREIAARGARALFVRADVAVESDVRAAIAASEDEFGGLDIVVNNASAPVPAGPLERWLQTIGVDLVGTMQVTLHAIEAMRRRGSGSVVNVASTSALGHGRKHSPWPAYDVAKAAVIRLTTSLDWLAEESGIRVTCLVPDWIASPPVKAFVESLTIEERRERGVPNVLTTPEEIADAVIRLVGDDSLTGRVLVWWSGQPRRFIPLDDPGYALLEVDERPD